MPCALVLHQDFPDVLMSEDADNRIDGTEESEEEDSGGSEEERSICLSPSKSPRKLSRALKRKRTLSEDQDETSDVESSEKSPEDGNALSLKDKEPTDEDFQFKEPKFRKKKFIFHPFSRNSEGSLVPDPSSRTVEVSSFPLNHPQKSVRAGCDPRAACRQLWSLHLAVRPCPCLVTPKMAPCNNGTFMYISGTFGSIKVN